MKHFFNVRMIRASLLIFILSLRCFISCYSQIKAPNIEALNIGEKLPREVWDMSFNTINPLTGKQTISLNTFKSKLIILDFWATYCSPCVASITKLDSLQKQFPDEIKVLTVHLFDYQNKAFFFMQKKKWAVSCILGEGDTLLNQLFFLKPRFGEVWIKDGKLFAIPRHKAVDATLIRKVLNNEKVIIPMDDYLTVFEEKKKIPKTM